MENTFYPYIEDDNFNDKYYDVNYALKSNNSTYSKYNNIENFTNKKNNNDNYIWGVNEEDNIFRKKKNNKWEKINGKLKNISASNKDYIWGTNKSDNIYTCKKPCTNGTWKKIDGSLEQVSGGNKEVWGINEANNIYRRDIDGSGSWKSMKGVLTNISASGNDYIWGVNNLVEEIKLRIKIVIGTKEGTNFNMLGKINKITLLGDTGTVSSTINVSKIQPINNDSTLIVDINISKDVKNIGGIQFDMNDTPILITELIIQIKDAFDKYHSIINSKNKKFINKKENTYSFKTFDLSKEIPHIYRCKTDCDGNWEYIKGNMEMVSGGSHDVWGLNKNGDVFKRSISKENADWVQVPGELKWISGNNDNYVWGVNNEDQIFKCKQPCNDGAWELVDGKLKQISGGYEHMEIKNNNTNQDTITRLTKEHDIFKKQQKEANKKDDDYLLLARQTVNGQFFPKKTLGTSQFNQEKTDDINYMDGSLLTNDFKFNDKYTFKLVWPNSDLKDQIWKQSSNPFKSNNVLGYEPIDIHYNINYWGGLRNGVGNTVLSGSMNGDWYYAIGTYKTWKGGIPGPNKPVSQVELYVKKNKYIIPKINLEKECGANYGKNIPCCNQPGTTIDDKYICSKEKPICIDYKMGSKWGKCVNKDYTKENTSSQNKYTLHFYAIGRPIEDGPNKIEISAGNNAILTFIPPKNIWKKYEVSFINNSSNFDLKFMGLLKEGDHSSAITEIHLLKDNITIFRNNFSNPQIKLNSYKYISSNNKEIPNWNFNAILMNNSTAWDYKIPYPKGNQAVCFQKNSQYISKNININKNNQNNKKIDALNRSMNNDKILLDNIKLPTQKDTSLQTLSKSVNISKDSLGNLEFNNSGIVDFYENFANSAEVNNLENLSVEALQEKNTSLLQKYEIQVNQLKEISEKEKNYHKNTKMLHLIQNKNAFKRKIISTLVAAIFLFIIIIIATFVYYKRVLK